MSRRCIWILAAVALLPVTTSAQTRRPLDHSVYDGWRTVEDSRISADGRWVVYSLTPQKGDAELQVRAVRGDTRHVVARGVDPAFAGDGRFVVFTIKPELARVSEARRRGAGRDELPEDSLGVLELATGRVTRIADVKSFKVPEDAGPAIAYLLDRPAADDDDESTGAGDPLVLLHLPTNAQHEFADVTDYVFSSDGTRLALLRDGAAEAEKGAFVVRVDGGTAQPLATGPGAYTRVALDERGRQAAFLTTRDDADAEAPAYAIYYWREGAAAAALDVEGGAGVPGGWAASEHRTPSFSDSGARLQFGTAPRPRPEVTDSTPEDERVKVDIWNWRDPLLQPMQLLQLREERERNYLAVAHLENGRVVQLATSEIPEVSIGRGGDAAVALGRSNLPYRQRISWDTPGYNDYYTIDVATGTRQRIARELHGTLSLSPGGEYAVWWDNVEFTWYARRLADDAVVNVTARVPTPLQNEEHDWPYQPNAYGSAGWTDGDETFLVYDRYDLWAVDPDGERAPRNVTAGAGRRDSVRYRYVRLDPDAETVPSNPLLSVFSYRTKDAGFARADLGRSAAPRVLLADAFRFGRPRKAREADRVMFTRESVVEYPDLWVSDLRFSDLERVSHANPQQGEYRWATVEPFDWRSASGEPLQGLVYKPDDFDPNRKYPTIVYFYERNSNNLHAHHPPIPHRSVIRPTFYASRGYVVFIPDITYDVGYPGQSAMDDVISGLLALVDEGYVDETNIGTQGHSWGGYQIAYLVTKTNIFKAAAGGAPVANMTSAYGGIRWGSGMSRMFQYEKTQSRLGGSLWEKPMRYIENSPIFWADRVETPLLMMHNDHDGAVPWEQGIEMFVALRRLGKPAWLVNYNDEPHWPTTYPNKVDWNIRMQQFFDHYLQGAPAPVWLAEGVPAVSKGKSLGLELVSEPATGNQP